MKTINKKAFTLIELLVVVLIIGILAAIGVPQYQKAVVKSRFSTLKNLTKSIAQAEEAYYLANGKYTNAFADLDINMPPHNNPYGRGYYEYDWGYCNLEISVYGNLNQVMCYRDNMQYRIRLNDSTEANTRICLAETTDINSPQAQVCQQETGSTGSNHGSYISWFYP